MVYASDSTVSNFIVHKILSTLPRKSVSDSFDKDWHSGLTIKRNRYLQDSEKTVIHWEHKNFMESANGKTIKKKPDWIKIRLAIHPKT